MIEHGRIAASCFVLGLALSIGASCFDAGDDDGCSCPHFPERPTLQGIGRVVSAYGQAAPGTDEGIVILTDHTLTIWYRSDQVDYKVTYSIDEPLIPAYALAPP